METEGREDKNGMEGIQKIKRKIRLGRTEQNRILVKERKGRIRVGKGRKNKGWKRVR